MALKTIVIAARCEEFELITPLTREASHPAILLAEGGQTRQESVWKAVQARAQAADYVLVHDAARPLVSASLIAAVCKRAQQCGAAIAATQASDTVKIMGADGNGLIESTLNRQNVYLAQTPQVFSRELFWKAFSRAEEEGFHGTDCASVLERAGYPVAIVDGEAVNFKVTYPQDLERAENLLLREEQVN